MPIDHLPVVTAAPARARVRKVLRAAGSVGTRRFSPDARSEALLVLLEAWAASMGLPPKVDPSAFLRLGLELLAIETQRANDSEHPEAAHRGLARRIESAAAGQRAEGAPKVAIESPGETTARRQRFEKTMQRVDELTEIALQGLRKRDARGRIIKETKE